MRAAPRESTPSSASAAHRLRSGQPQCAVTSRRAAMHRRADAVASGASTSRSPRSQATSARSSPTRRAVSPPAVASSRCRQSREGMVRCRWFMPGEVSAGGVPEQLISAPPPGIRSPESGRACPPARQPAPPPTTRFQRRIPVTAPRHPDEPSRWRTSPSRRYGAWIRWTSWSASAPTAAWPNDRPCSRTSTDKQRDAGGLATGRAARTRAPSPRGQLPRPVEKFAEGFRSGPPPNQDAFGVCRCLPVSVGSPGRKNSKGKESTLLATLNL